MKEIYLQNAIIGEVNKSANEKLICEPFLAFKCAFASMQKKGKQQNVK